MVPNLPVQSWQQSSVSGWMIKAFYLCHSKLYLDLVCIFWFFFRYYSMYGHVAKLAQEIEKGASSVEGVEVKLFQVRVARLSGIIQK